MRNEWSKYPSGFGKRGLRAQVGAICVRRGEGGVMTLLVRTRTTRSWVVPKGWPEPGASLHDAAAREAREEAGVIGSVSPNCVGAYSYMKLRDANNPFELPCVVLLYGLIVSSEIGGYQESYREKGWFFPDEAASLTGGDLGAAISAFCASYAVTPDAPAVRPFAFSALD